MGVLYHAKNIQENLWKCRTILYCSDDCPKDEKYYKCCKIKAKALGIKIYFFYPKLLVSSRVVSKSKMSYCSTYVTLRLERFNITLENIYWKTGGYDCFSHTVELAAY